jgi:SAM-dependent methyltransferase
VKVFYETLAPLWSLISPVQDYEEEAAEYLRILQDVLPGARTLLELGAGGGHNAYYMKHRFAATLTDLSAQMLAISRALNPECEHVVGDMRSLDLGRTFDVVFVHDAIDYMVTRHELAAAMATAFRHCRPGGVALFVPDHVKERYEPTTDCGGSDAPDGSGIRYLEWSFDPDPEDDVGTVRYEFVIRGSDGTISTAGETHTFGLFAESVWVDLLRQAGFRVEIVEESATSDHLSRLFFVGRRPE